MYSKIRRSLWNAKGTATPIPTAWKTGFPWNAGVSEPAGQWLLSAIRWPLWPAACGAAVGNEGIFVIFRAFQSYPFLSFKRGPVFIHIMAHTGGRRKIVNILNRHIQKTMQFLTETAWFLIVWKMGGKTVCSANPEIMVLFGLSKKLTFLSVKFYSVGEFFQKQ